MARVHSARNYGSLASLAFVALLFASCGHNPAGPSAPPPPGQAIPTPAPEATGVPPFMAGRTPVRVALLLPLSASSSDMKGHRPGAPQISPNSRSSKSTIRIFFCRRRTRTGQQTAPRLLPRKRSARGAELILGPLLREEVTCDHPAGAAASRSDHGLLDRP